MEESSHFIRSIEFQLVVLGYESKHFGNSNNTYSLWYNFIFLNLLYVVMKHLNYLGVTEKDQKSDSSTDLLTLKHTLINRLDPYLRLQVQKRGMTIFQNVYTAFDTEYELESYKKSMNKLISTQIAVQARTIIKVPLFKPLDISYVHPLTSEISSFYTPKVEEWTPPSIIGGRTRVRTR